MSAFRGARSPRQPTGATGAWSPAEARSPATTPNDATFEGRAPSRAGIAAQPSGDGSRSARRTGARALVESRRPWPRCRAWRGSAARALTLRRSPDTALLRAWLAGVRRHRPAEPEGDPRPRRSTPAATVRPTLAPAQSWQREPGRKPFRPIKPMTHVGEAADPRLVVPEPSQSLAR